MNRFILLSKPLSDNQADHHLELVLCKIDFGAHRFVIWTKAIFEGVESFEHGHYFADLENAIKKFKSMGVEK
jgi:hypothetical protein